MNRKDFEIELKKRCPKVFELLRSPRTVGGCYQPIQLGLEVDEGWHDIIMSCAIKLESLNEGVVAAQVKEKFGDLRFYIDGGSEQAYKVICEAETEASKTCEFCGAPGILRKARPWWKTLCDTCSKHKVKVE